MLRVRCNFEAIRYILIVDNLVFENSLSSSATDRKLHLGGKYFKYIRGPLAVRCSRSLTSFGAFPIFPTSGNLVSWKRLLVE